MGSKLMIKGKRSKRQRFASTMAMAMAAPSSSSSTSSGGTYTTCSNNNKYSGGLISSTSMMSTPPPHESNISVPTNSVELQFTKSTQVEQDMANCLILLAQGQKLAHDQKTQAITMPGLYNYNVFRCKTCERAFPSFQALGGHRASHKRPKPAPAVQKVMVVPMDGEQHHKLSQFSTCTTTTLSLKISSCNNKSSSSSSRVHECSICGSEFASGQALGGHMRRHRSTLVLPPPPPIYDHGYSKKQPTNILSLDLNVLPPLEDESEFPFPLKEQVIVLSPSALVN